ncbi:MAG TPA: sterol desaturase family protein [Acidimicrobiales bacterium]|nr:sterol desaturase family protein [Acidimicrobiales bacterium]
MTSLIAVSAMLVMVSVLERVPRMQFAPRGLARPFLATDGAWYLVATGANLITTFVFQPVLSRLAVPGMSDSVASLPLVPRLVLGLVVYDAVAFLVHVGIHRSEVLWSVHKVHHSSLNLDAMATTRTHVFEHMMRNLPAQAALFALGFTAQGVAFVLLVYASFALVGHSNLRIGNRRVELLFVTPRLHRLHHVPASSQQNFGTVFTMWDRLAGRLLVRDAAADERTGVPGEVDLYPQRFAAAFRQPVREASRRRSLSRVAS